MATHENQEYRGLWFVMHQLAQCPDPPGPERCTVRNSPALRGHWLLVRSLLQRYDTHEPGLCALICTLASPEVCSRATPGDGRTHEKDGELFDCSVCHRRCCTWCEWRVFCGTCDAFVRQCGRCNVRPWTCPQCHTSSVDVYFLPNTPMDIRERNWHMAPYD